ncbi:MAG: Ribonuclease Z [uncultured bacterium]|nr:MAG: Ribonuclease Z [uncultured bacterium]
MSIETKILGIHGQDNSLFVKLDTGHHIYQILFDCGQSGFSNLGKSILQEMDHLFLSHCHMDHISGFDGLFRHLYSRRRPFIIWGPKDIINIIHCRIKGFTWNLVDRSPGEVIVNEITEDEIVSAKFLCREGFKNKYPLSTEKYTDGEIYRNADFNVKCKILDHKTDCLAYSVIEEPRKNINPEKMEKYNFKPGKWCSHLKQENLPLDLEFDLEGKIYSCKELYDMLVEVNTGMKVTYVTDIIMNTKNRERILELASNADKLIIESTYKESEIELANKNYHLTVNEAALVAKDANVKKLVLFHVSDRYTKNDLREMLTRAIEIFPESHFPSFWKIGKLQSAT